MLKREARAWSCFLVDLLGAVIVSFDVLRSEDAFLLWPLVERSMPVMDQASFLNG